MRLLIAGGGTGGHVYPGLAVAEAMRLLQPTADVRFCGTRRGLEATLVPAAGWRLHTVPASGLRGLGPVARARFLANLAAGGAAALALLVRWRPDVVLGTGGYASAPALLAARLLGVPVALQEQNAVPGSANRLLARCADRLYLGTAAAAARFPGRDCLVTGNPVRAAFRAAPAGPAGASGGLSVLMFGGSGGARTLNRAAGELAALWRGRDDVTLVVQTGPAGRDEVAAAFAGWAPERARVTAYIDDMATALAGADLAICRAGAMTLAELAVAGRPAVLVPFPHATDDHQWHNAEDVAADGAAVVVRDGSCDGAALAAIVDDLGRDRPRLAAMARASAARARPDAARRIAADLLRLAGRAGPGA
ncbi:MAG: undecaprenyldiphospho-muramoylpentapeptide beta-N-acetylglucosaminyltransferase [Candidatus Krumholzibacteriia bacterium]